MVARIVGKYAAGLAKKDPTGYTKTVVDNMVVERTVQRLKKDELETLLKSGSSTEKHYAKQELERRAANKDTAKNLKSRQAKGELTEKQVKNRMAANKQKVQSSDDMRDSILNEYERSVGPRNEEAFSKGGMPKKKAIVAKKSAAVKKPAVKKPAVKKYTMKGK